MTWQHGNAGGSSRATTAVPRQAAQNLRANHQQRVAEWVDAHAPVVGSEPEEFQVEVVEPDAVASSRGQARRQGKRVRFASPERGKYYWRRVVR